eukprot:snap_masked-scaffold_46-processed-gene-1.81-mRNA-1 protein AED:1.00 eAED:1.00 QI:0/0/0/0/1/1/2/0/89
MKILHEIFSEENPIKENYIYFKQVRTSFSLRNLKGEKAQQSPEKTKEPEALLGFREEQGNNSRNDLDAENSHFRISFNNAISRTKYIVL